VWAEAQLKQVLEEQNNKNNKMLDSNIGAFFQTCKVSILKVVYQSNCAS
jgi:hypothetical protein